MINNYNKMTKVTKKSLHLDHVADCICFSPLTREDKEYLTGKGIDISHLPFSIYSIELSRLGQVLHGIGIRNESGGVEFYDYKRMKRPATVHKNGISIIKSGYKKSQECCAFANFLDYMSYMTRVRHKEKKMDCIILNHSFNCLYFIMECEFYRKIHLFLPNTPAGKILSQTIIDRNPTARNWSSLYWPCLSFFSSLKTKIENGISNSNIRISPHWSYSGARV